MDAETSEYEVPAVLRDAPPPPPPERTYTRRKNVLRPAVALVDGDRFGRSSLARALVQAQCDVTVLDGVVDLVKILEGTEPVDVLVTDVDGLEIELVLEAMQRLRPEVPVLAWTKSARAVAEHVLMTASVETYDVVARNARTSDVIELVRKLAGAA
jgi:CheY-like chemotaxis protein